MLYFLEDSLKTRHPLVNDSYRSPIEIFDATVYKKGAFVIHMLREEVGDAHFWKSLNKYLTENQNRVVETSDLQRAFEETTGKQLDWFFDQWVYKAGFPDLRVRSFYHAPTRRLTMEVTQTQKVEGNTPAAFRLPVDIEISTASGNRTERVEITARSQRFVFKLDGKPLVVRFDKGERILKKVDFPQPASTLKYQLVDGAGNPEHTRAQVVYVGAGTSPARFGPESHGQGQALPLQSAFALNFENEAEDFILSGLLRKVFDGKYRRQGPVANALLIFHDKSS
jgi:aminopeptidase N